MFRRKCLTLEAVLIQQLLDFVELLAHLYTVKRGAERMLLTVSHLQSLLESGLAPIISEMDDDHYHRFYEEVHKQLVKRSRYSVNEKNKEFWQSMSADVLFFLDQLGDGQSPEAINGLPATKQLIES